ncbi:guanylate kinase [Thermoflexus sp.]|uniref:guanylate kinase n=1 Tax=Thermoflexus sp. TaxID=1969742 RepID=UPI0025D7DF67|nr:guanylate kinase [Thermoflexus sp.]MDW8179581.1 guanylate kinase [Anaerolineae bacterium]MCS6964332.1 guanylate kinase [Thermoflexus sp.]MCS7350132.1 guanylate kinase [Thermoflexus sp.]MCX7689497.1 guanylate kinase [Thermoflexus sp.]MDW8184907.1 guanylate kinase [Anaerolineae bacterium]
MSDLKGSQAQKSVSLEEPTTLEELARRPTWPLVVVISGPSGAGKDSLIRRMKELKVPFHFVVTATSRPPRPGEVDGVDYHFLSRERFEAGIQAGEFLEYAIVYGDYKGIPRWEIENALASGKDVILRVDVQGAATLRRLIPDAVFIFVIPASREELIERLRARGTETVESIARRLQAVEEELRHWTDFDYVVVNRDQHLDEAVNDILAIIRTEHCRAHPRRAHLEHPAEVSGSEL